jgi:hypothetical protein
MLLVGIKKGSCTETEVQSTVVRTITTSQLVAIGSVGDAWITNTSWRRWGAIGAQALSAGG